MRESSSIEIRVVDGFHDDRGLSLEIPEELRRDWPAAHVVMNRPGALRGNHSHPNAEELLFVQGPAVVSWRSASDVEARNVQPEQVLRFRFPPGVPHAVRNVGSEPSLLVSLQRPVDDSPVSTVSERIVP